MTSEDRPWEPPLAADEQGALLGALDRLRWTFRYKVDGLDRAGLSATVGASSLTLGALLKHLAAVEDYYSTARLSGAEWGDPWSGVDWEASPGWDFTSAADDAPAALYALYDAAVARSRDRFASYLAEGDLGREVAAGSTDTRANARRLVCDLVEEYGRHTGHADLLRESVDGRVGEDPPSGWRPSGVEGAALG